MLTDEYDFYHAVAQFLIPFLLQLWVIHQDLEKSKGKIAQNEQKTRKTEENEQKSEVFPPFFSLIRFFLLILHPILSYFGEPGR